MAPANQDRWRIESQSLLWLLWCAFQMNAWARTGMKGKKPSTYAFRISLSLFRSFLKANKDTLKSFTIINLEKKNETRPAKPCVRSIYSQIVANTDGCVGCATIVSSCDLAVSEVFGVQAGGGRKV